MNTATATNSTSNPLIFARQIVGMAILALANPMVWYSNEPVLRWLESWGVPVLIALAAFGLYALVFTKRAKQSWPGRFFLLAWVLVALVTAGPWINLSKRGAAPMAAQTPALMSNDVSTKATGAGSFDPSTAKPVKSDQWIPAPSGLKPFDGKLDGEK